MSKDRAASGDQQFPRPPLLAIGGLLLFCLVTVALVQINKPDAAPAPSADAAHSAPIADRLALVFRDLDNGAVGVFDPASGDLLTSIAPGTNGFMRSTLRGLGRERMRRNLTMATPVEIQILENGRALLVDPAIDREIDLWAFGEINAMNFINLYRETKAILNGEQHQVASQMGKQSGAGNKADNSN